MCEASSKSAAPKPGDGVKHFLGKTHKTHKTPEGASGGSGCRCALVREWQKCGDQGMYPHGESEIDDVTCLTCLGEVAITAIQRIKTLDSELSKQGESQ